MGCASPRGHPGEVTALLGHTAMAECNDGQEVMVADPTFCTPKTVTLKPGI